MSVLRPEQLQRIAELHLKYRRPSYFVVPDGMLPGDVVDLEPVIQEARGESRRGGEFIGFVTCALFMLTVFLIVRILP